ncbi:MAG: NAD(P)/FAD-dependent oxidoreductase, partial [Nocardioidaceae bacterium]
MAHQQFVIVGGSLAGVKAAETLRSEGFKGSIVMVDADEVLPYDRPPLSKAALKGEDGYDTAMLHDEQWYADNDIEMRRGSPVWRLDLSAHNVYVHQQEKLHYDKLLLATGSAVRRIDVPGADAQGVHYLRTLAESQRLKERFESKPHVVVVGAGWIGLEVAAAAREYGAEVTVVEPEPTPLHTVVGPEMGMLFADLHQEHGVRFHFGARLTEIVGQDGMVQSVRTDDGDEHPAHDVLAAIGAAPRSALAESAGLELSAGPGGGIAVDASLRTSDP